MATKRNRYKLSEAKQQMQDAVGGSDIEFETDDGTVFHLEHPLFRSKTTKDALEPIGDDDSEGIVEVLLGEEQYEKFLSVGGDPDDVNFLLMKVQQDMQDVMRRGRQSRPTRSSASSGSGQKPSKPAS